MALELLSNTITSRRVANLEKVATGLSHTKVLLAIDASLMLAAASPLFGCTPGYEPGLVTPSPDLGSLTEPEKARMESIKTSFIEASEGKQIISGLEDKKYRGSIQDLLAKSLSQITAETITTDQIDGFTTDEIVPNWTESVGLVAIDVSYIDHDDSTKTLRFMFGQGTPGGEWGQVNFFIEGNNPDVNGHIKETDIALDVSNGNEPNIWGMQIVSDNEVGFSSQLFFKDINGTSFIINHSPDSSIADIATPVSPNANFLVGDGPPNNNGTVNVSFKFAAPAKINVTATPSTDSTPATATTEATADGPELNVSDEVKAVLEAQKAPYTVNALGEAVVTVSGKEITLTGLVDTKTDFGLAEDILNGYDKQTGDWYLFTEKGGWAKVIEPGTPEIRTVVKYEDFGSGLVNASAALQYEKNPTIPEGAIEPQWWLSGSGSKESGGYNAYLSMIAYQGGEKELQFTRSTKPFGSPILWLEFSKDGKAFNTVVQPAKNPSAKDKDRLTLLNWTFDGDYYEEELVRYLDNIKNNKVKHDNIVDYFLNDSTTFKALIAADLDRSTIHDKFPHLFGPDGILSTGALQRQGEQLGLFPHDVQEFIRQVWEKKSQVPWGEIPLSEVEINLQEGVPPELSLKALLADSRNFPWGDIKP